MDSMDFNWLHLSDFHIGKDNYAQSKIIEYILEEIKIETDKNNKLDFIFITGDLANKGLLGEFKSFEDLFVVPLLEIMGDQFSSRVFTVPGNHDVDRKKAKAVKRYDILNEIQSFLDPTEEALEDRQPLLPRFKAFNDHQWMIEMDKWISSADGFHTRRIQLPTLEVGVLSINTSWFCGGDGDRFMLTPGLPMVEEGLRKLKGCAVIFVLGHHPVEWMLPTDSKRFLVLLRDANAIYLHGHLHKTESATQLIGDSAVLCMQAGCAFVARNDEKWLSRILWGGFDVKSRQIHVHPKKWNADHNEWVTDIDAFPSILRIEGQDTWLLPFGRQKQADPAKKRSAHYLDEGLKAPEGWEILTDTFFLDRQEKITTERILQYFEGRVPSWGDVLSGFIAERSMVEDLLSAVIQGVDDQDPKLTLLLGAGGEGKSTVFLQTLRRISLTKKAEILWRYDPEKELPRSFIAKLVATGKCWIIATDEADSMIGDLYQVFKEFRDYSKLHVFITCRDTDWINNRGNDFQWSQMCNFTERNMKGLDEHDARLIVDSWARFGPRGLGKLADSSPEEATRLLVEAARLEASHNDGAFLGAMLRVRVGAALKDHVANLMIRLNSRKIVGVEGRTMLDAFMYIAIPHAFNILFLSKSVLAKAVGIEESKVRRRVLLPLGEEAAAEVTGQYVLTRHRAIAEAAMELASSRFDLDPEDVLEDLVRSALVANEESSMVPHLSEWRYLSSRLFEQGNQSLGVRLAAAAVATDPTNSYLVVKLAQLYREAGQAEQSANVFRRSYDQARGNRAFYTEWATCEGFLRNRALSIWINAVSISDNIEQRPPDIRDISFGLAGCFINFLNLYESYQNYDFLNGAAAADQIARQMSLPKAAFDILDGRLSDFLDLRPNCYSSGTALLGAFVTGVKAARAQCEIEISSAIPNPEVLSFEALKRTARLFALRPMVHMDRRNPRD